MMKQNSAGETAVAQRGRAQLLGMGPPTFLLLLLGGATTVLAADGRVVYPLTTTGTLPATCAPGSWVDFELSVTGLENSNLMFEVEDKGDSYNPQGLFVALWDGDVPSDRAAEHFTDRAAGKYWAVGLNNKALRLCTGTVTLGVQCGPYAAVNFEVHVVEVPAVLTVGAKVHGEVCPGEWVYHYVDITAAAAANLRYTIDAAAGAGAALAVTRHLEAPLKTVPPYLSMAYSSSQVIKGEIDMCSVEAGPMYLGILGVESEGGCMKYDVTATEFTGDCQELMHQSEADPAALADTTLQVADFTRASCGPYQWYDFYFDATEHMVEIEDNIVFEVEMQADQFEMAPGGVSVHLFQGTIPLDRKTERVSTVPDGGLFSLAIPSIELQVGPYYLSVQCGASAQRFRTIAFEIRGRMNGPGDAVHGEICPQEFLYHSVVPTFNDVSSRRQLGAVAAAENVTAGDHIQFTFTKHSGDFVFMSLVGDHPPTRKQPPSRTIHYDEVVDFGIFCNLQPGNRYWIALLGGEHCATYDLHMSKLDADEPRCATGEYMLVPNEVASTGITELVKERPTYASCSPSEYVDFFVPLTYDADSDDNLRFQLQLLNEGTRPGAVKLLVYQDGEISTDRKTEIFADRAVDGVYSVTINSIDLKYQLCKATNFAGSSCGHGHGYSSDANATNATDAGGHRRLGGAGPVDPNATAADLTYFVSVQCSEADSASFKLLATKIKSHLVNNIQLHGELCPGNFIYHHWEHMHVGEERSVRFRITKHGGDGSVMVRTGASFDAAPLKLEPPYLFMDTATEHAYVEYCNATDMETTSEHVFVMLVGGSHCMSYEIMSMEVPNGECVGMGHGSETNGYDQATDISPHHFMYASCSGSEWVDFKLTLSASDFHYNYLIEVEDLVAATGLPDPTALSLHMYDNAIPQNRQTDHKALRAIDGMYSLAINQHNFHEGYTFLSVKCEDAGAVPRRFRMVIYQIEEYLTLDQEYHGVVSPGEWVYHSYSVPTDGSPHNFTFHLVKHTGDLDIVVRHDVVPLKLIPPYTHVGHHDYEADTQVCNARPGEKVYLGMLGGAHAASYEIIASELPVGAPCQEPPHASAGSNATTSEMHQLQNSIMSLGNCKAGGWYDAFVDVSRYDMQNNLIFELEDMGKTGALDAVSVFMWAGEIPLTRKSQYFTDRSFDDVYSLAISKHEFEPFLHDGSSMVRIFFGVLCGAKDVEFRSFVSFVKSKMDTSHAAHGEVCPGDWVYHYLPIDDALMSAAANSGSAATLSFHRRRRLAGVSPRSRKLAAAATDEPGVHVKLRIIKNKGSMNLMYDLNSKPLRLIPSETTVMATEDTMVDKIICNVDRFYRNTSSPMRYYLAVNGGEVCAHYEVEVEAFDTSCAEAQAKALRPGVHATESHGAPGARECPQTAVDCVLSMRHYMRASCEPGERAPPFVINIPYAADEPLDNMVVTVEDLNMEDNPNSLFVSLYPECGADTCTHTRLASLTPLATTDSSRERIFSIGRSSLEMHEAVCGGKCTSSGTYKLSMSVRCTSTAVRFRVVAIFTTIALDEGVPIHGEVCPGNWIFHRFFVPDTQRVRESGGVHFSVHVHTGDIYYAMSRWGRKPGFTACNGNEFAMSLLRDGGVDLCNINDEFDKLNTDGSAARRRQLAGDNSHVHAEASSPAATSNALRLEGHMGLFGGDACADYSILVTYLPANSNCSTEASICL